MSIVNATQHNKVKYYVDFFFSICVCVRLLLNIGARAGVGDDISGQFRKEANTFMIPLKDEVY